MSTIETTYEIYIKGLVQGVGFRPFVYRIATQHGKDGYVENRNDGVFVKLQADYPQVNAFLDDLKRNSPPASSIRTIEVAEGEPESFDGFQIRNSKIVSDQVTEISPDIAVCYDCLEDMKMQPRRINYPFINCTHCGPRFSIIKDLPYDRSNTTMHEFQMCGDCKEEYHDVHDRRFHAQPVACNFCGPQYKFFQQGRVIKDTFKILKELKKLLYRGKIIAVKGVGGFHLICDATNNKVVERLRKLKNRDRKPFAVMFSDLDSLKEYAFVTEEEKNQLLSWRRPVVLLQQKKVLAESINNGLGELGVLFPYMPLHFLIFEEIDLSALVFTSANLSNEPMIADNEIAAKKLEHIADAFLFHNREIQNRTDDSVIRILNSQPQLIRRSRGYAPAPVPLDFDVSGILATGAELKNTFAVGMKDQAVLSQHIGDLKNYETYEFFGDAVNRFLHLFRQNPQFVVSDMHPEYLSTRFAKNFHAQQERKAGNNKNLSPQWLQVQHHHAHIASCMAEHGLNEDVIGIAMDGTGYGDDGQIWGGEFMKCNLSGYQRFAHFEYVPMPGGDKAVQSPWRMALSFLANAFDDQEEKFSDLAFLQNRPIEDIKLILSMIRKRLNSPLTSSAGRLFDAVAALLGVCTEACFEAEAPMRLEALVLESVTESYSFDFNEGIVSFASTFREIVEDITQGVSIELIATKFHNTVTEAIVEVANSMREQYRLSKVALSGGTFQNRYLTEQTITQLEHADFEVYFNRHAPCNDGGISLGQLAIAANK